MLKHHGYALSTPLSLLSWSNRHPRELRLNKAQRQSSLQPTRNCSHLLVPLFFCGLNFYTSSSTQLGLLPVGSLSPSCKIHTYISILALFSSSVHSQTNPCRQRQIIWPAWRMCPSLWKDCKPQCAKDDRPVSFCIFNNYCYRVFLHFHFPNFIPKKEDVCGRLRCPWRVTIIITIKYSIGQKWQGPNSVCNVLFSHCTS